MFGTTKIDFKQEFSALFTDDVTAPVFWLSHEEQRRKLGIRKNENAFVLQLGAEVAREYVLKSDQETFAAIERVFEGRRAGDPDSLISDNRRIRAALPWVPQYDDLPTIVTHALAWERKLTDLRRA